MFTEYIKRQRLSKSLSQAEIAAIMGTSQSYYCTIERGKRKPGLKMLRRIATALDVSVETLRSIL